MSLAHKIQDCAPETRDRQVGTASRVSALLEKGIEEGVVGGGIALVSCQGEVIAHLSRGARVGPKAHSCGEPIFPDTVFDLGALTESVCTATLMLHLFSVGKLSLLDRASRFIQSLGVGQRNRITLAHLLAHASGYPVYLDLYEELAKANSGPRPGILASTGGRSHAFRLAHAVELQSAPGTERKRSDLDYLILGEICEIVTGMSLEKAFSRFVAAPLGLKSLNFIDLDRTRGRSIKPIVELFAPIGECPERARLICGEVWDLNTWGMGGVAGNNGLFGTAEDLLVWAHEIISALKDRSRLCNGEVARSFVQPTACEVPAEWSLGFEKVTYGDGVSGGTSIEVLVAESETGCSVMIEPETEIVAVFLMSGGFAGGATRGYHTLRDELHAAVLETGGS